MRNILQVIPKIVWKGKVIMICFFFLAACMQYDEGLAPRNHLNDLLSDDIIAQASDRSTMAKGTFTAHLTGGNEVPANDSQGQGQVIFKLSADGTELHYKLIVANIENVRAAHIHCGATGVNGPVVVPLFGTQTVGVQNGVLVEGTITNANVRALACIGSVKSLEAVLELIRNGGAYVNVHTTLLPAGEIRGQIQ